MKPYACHSKPRSDGYWAQTMLHHECYTPERAWVWIEDKMTQECQYRKGVTDPRCDGCKKP